MNNSTQEPQIDQLKSIRKKQKITVDSMAGMMKVSKNFVRAIESGNLEKLGAPTFLRGHITNYCKALNIEPQAILRQVPEQFLKHQQLQTSNAMGASPLARVRRQSNHLGKYAVGTALLGMLCLSFYFVWDKWSLPLQSDSLNNNIAISQNGEDNGEKITYSSLIPQVAGPDNSNNSEASQLTESDDNPQNESIQAENNSAELEESGAENAANLDLLEADSTTEINSSTEQNSILTSAYLIRLDLKEQAWVSIKTQNGESIVQDLLGPGVNEFSAQEPLQIRLGNALNLQLSINDVSVELAPHTNKDVADFEWPLTPSS